LGALEEKLLSCDNKIKHLKLVIAKLRRMIALGTKNSIFADSDAGGALLS
jgi:hypothetical protein